MWLRHAVLSNQSARPSTKSLSRRNASSRSLAASRDSARVAFLDLRAMMVGASGLLLLLLLLLLSLSFPLFPLHGSESLVVTNSNSVVWYSSALEGIGSVSISRFGVTAAATGTDRKRSTVHTVATYLEGSFSNNFRNNSDPSLRLMGRSVSSLSLSLSIPNTQWCWILWLVTSDSSSWSHERTCCSAMPVALLLAVVEAMAAMLDGCGAVRCWD
mmetsp:Transcript_10701/g.31219  ORF Transcript_10701/g.31219 Transcript_10701/m.31219 type:complete len:215 (+) Transcript_10701:1625-2269(+)